jgi:hypothetical protein
LFCFVLFCFVLFCFVLFCFVLFCFVLFCFVFVFFRRLVSSSCDGLLILYFPFVYFCFAISIQFTFSVNSSLQLAAISISSILCYSSCLSVLFAFDQSPWQSCSCLKITGSSLDWMIFVLSLRVVA